MSAHVEIIRVAELFDGSRSFHIPPYQRPYSWSERSALRLLDDIAEMTTERRTYRLGTMIACGRGTERSGAGASRGLDVVDGQQRYLTLALLGQALGLGWAASVSLPSTHARASLTALQRNAEALRRRLETSPSLHERLRKQLGQPAEELGRCEILLVTTSTTDTALTMFDSLNSRGKDLHPVDLLKAYHLRVAEELGETEDEGTVHELLQTWDGSHEDVERLFDELLLPILRWTANESVPRGGMTPDDVVRFTGIRRRSGVRPGQAAPWERIFLADLDAHRADPSEASYQLEHPVIDGLPFLHWTEHYLRLARQVGALPARSNDAGSDSDKAREDTDRVGLLGRLDDEHARTLRDRDRYSDRLHRCLRLALVDRFGAEALDEAANEYLARYAYLRRATQGSLQWTSVDNFVRDSWVRSNQASGITYGENLLLTIRRARTAREVTGRPLPSIGNEDDIAGTKSLRPALTALYGMGNTHDDA